MANFRSIITICIAAVTLFSCHPEPDLEVSEAQQALDYYEYTAGNLETPFAFAGEFERAVLQLDTAAADVALEKILSSTQEKESALYPCPLPYGDSLELLCREWLTFYRDSAHPLYAQAATLIKYDSLPVSVKQNIRDDFAVISEQDLEFRERFEALRRQFLEANGVTINDSI